MNKYLEPADIEKYCIIKKFISEIGKVNWLKTNCENDGQKSLKKAVPKTAQDRGQKKKDGCNIVL